MAKIPIAISVFGQVKSVIVEFYSKIKIFKKMNIANPRCWCVSPDNLRFLFEMNL